MLFRSGTGDQLADIHGRPYTLERRRAKRALETDPDPLSIDGAELSGRDRERTRELLVGAGAPRSAPGSRVAEPDGA